MGSEDKTILEYDAPTGQVRPRNGRSWLGLLVLALFAVLLAFQIWLISVSRGRPSKQAECMANMRSIGQMLFAYSHKQKTGPPNLHTLTDYLLRVSRDSTEPTRDEVTAHYRVCVCPSSSTPSAAPPSAADYVLTAASATDLYRLTPDTIVLYETACRHNGRMNILFADGSVRSISGAESQAMLADLNAGKNPPPSLQSKVGR